MKLVENIKRVCAARKITVLDLEKAAGLPKNSIYKWDAHSPAYYKVVAVADILQCSLDELCR